MSTRISRKEFLTGTLALTSAGAVVAALTGCGKDNSTSNSTSPMCLNGAINGTITGNHGHSLAVPAADIQAAAQKTYSIQGISLHDHTVTLTPAQFAQLAQNQTFTVMSTTDAGHSHTVTVMCA